MAWSVGDDCLIDLRERTTCSVSGKAGSTSFGARRAWAQARHGLVLWPREPAWWWCRLGGADDRGIAIPCRAMNEHLLHDDCVRSRETGRGWRAQNVRGAKHNDCWRRRSYWAGRIERAYRWPRAVLWPSSALAAKRRSHALGRSVRLDRASASPSAVISQRVTGSSGMAGAAPWRGALCWKMGCEPRISVKWPAGVGPRKSHTAAPRWLSGFVPRYGSQGRPSD